MAEMPIAIAGTQIYRRMPHLDSTSDYVVEYEPSQQTEPEVTFVLTMSVASRFGVAEMNRRSDLWSEITTKHLRKLFFVGLMWLVGISDLSSYLFNQQPLLHWYNDLLIMFGAAGLLGTIILISAESIDSRF